MDLRELQNKTAPTNRHPWELARVEIIMRFLKNATKNIAPSTISVIDVGCGDLFVLDTIRNTLKYDELVGIDIALSTDDIKTLNNTYQSKNIKVLNNLNDLTIHSNNVSVILLNDVIEHIEDDKNFLIDLQKNSAIKEKSIFIITVPAYQSLFCSHDIFLLHYRRYTNSSLVNLLKSTNYTVTSGGYFFTVLLLPRIIQVLKEKMSGTKKNPEEIKGTDLTDWNGSKALSSLLKFILLSDYFITSFFLKLKIKLPGLSTFAICKKSA